MTVKGWIKIEKHTVADGYKVVMSASPDVEVEDEVYLFDFEEEAWEALDLALLYAEELRKQGRVTEIAVHGERPAAVRA